MSARGKKKLGKALKGMRAPLLSGIVAVALLLGGAWYWGGEPAEAVNDAGAEGDAILMVRVPAQDAGRVTGWESFFGCYGLREDDVIQWTMQRWAERPGGDGGMRFDAKKPIEVVLHSKRSLQLEPGMPFYAEIKKAVVAGRNGECPAQGGGR